MTPEEIKIVLEESAKLRMPRFTTTNGGPPIMAREKIGKLEDYLLATARWRSFLEEARVFAHSRLRADRRKWAHMTGWEGQRREGERSVASVEDAKRATDPALYDSIEECEWLVKRLSDQIRRLEHDDDVASRAYTFITGGG